MKKIIKIAIPLLVLAAVFGMLFNGPSPDDFRIKRDEAFLTKNLGRIVTLSVTLMNIADHMKAAMKVVLRDNKLNALKAVNLKYEVKNYDDEHFRIATLHIPLAEWRAIPERQRKDFLWIECNLERWKKVIHYDLVMEIRKKKKEYGY